MNVYAHGKGDQEKRVNLWFDSFADYRSYSIPRCIFLMLILSVYIFMVDDAPIRFFKNNKARGVPYPKS
eukprot:Gb_18744 [translate_table: standard]